MLTECHDCASAIDDDVQDVDGHGRHDKTAEECAICCSIVSAALGMRISEADAYVIAVCKSQAGNELVEGVRTERLSVARIEWVIDDQFPAVLSVA